MYIYKIIDYTRASTYTHTHSLTHSRSFLHKHLHTNFYISKKTLTRFATRGSNVTILNKKYKTCVCMIKQDIKQIIRTEFPIRRNNL